MFKAVGKDSLKIYVVEDTKALVFQKLKEKYPRNKKVTSAGKQKVTNKIN